MSMESLKKLIGFVVGFAVVSGGIYLVRGGDRLKKFEPYHSDQGQFSVLFPGKPTKKLQLLRTPAGEIDLWMFSAGSKKSVFVVGYADYPQRLINNSDPTRMLDGARDGAVRNVRGSLVDETEIDFYGYPARELEIEVPQKGTVGARLILIDNRLYQVMVVSQSARILDRKGSEFLDSFSVDGIE